jgi:hypothetical protein
MSDGSCNICGSALHMGCCNPMMTATATAKTEMAGKTVNLLFQQADRQIDDGLYEGILSKRLYGDGPQPRMGLVTLLSPEEIEVTVRKDVLDFLIPMKP